jgi:LmbE family N-acetylglucosaminyl deacetylase
MPLLPFAPTLPATGTVLCLGAHCDDIDIGCGGTLMELQRRHPGLRFEWIVFSGDATREAETRAAAARLLGDACRVDVRRFPCSYFPYEGAQIKDAFESIKEQVDPDLIFSHFLADRHQDHRVIGELTWNTFRNHTILEYELVKFEGDLAHPNLYVPLAEDLVRRKVETLVDCFASQRSHAWFDADLFRGHLRLRGAECNAASRHAEAFHARKLIL